MQGEHRYLPRCGWIQCGDSKSFWNQHGRGKTESISFEKSMSRNDQKHPTKHESKLKPSNYICLSKAVG